MAGPLSGMDVDLEMYLRRAGQRPHLRRAAVEAIVVLVAAVTGGVVGFALINAVLDLLAGTVERGVLLLAVVVPVGLVAWALLIREAIVRERGAMTHFTANEFAVSSTWSNGRVEPHRWNDPVLRFRVVLRKRSGPNYEHGFLTFPGHQETEFRRSDGEALLAWARYRGHQILVKETLRRRVGPVTIYESRAPR